MEPVIVTASASLVEILPIIEAKTKPIVVNHNGNGNGTALRGIKPPTDKEKVTEILSALENVLLNLQDVNGQGFLFNATASIRLYLQQK